MSINPNSFLGKSVSRGFYESVGFNYSKEGVKGKFLGSFGAGLSLAFTGYSAYSGFKEGGISGGIKETAQSIGMNMAFNTGINLIRTIGPASIPILGATAMIGGMHALGKAGENKRRNIQRLDFSAAGPNTIMNSGAVTARQRAINALNDTRINARAALGNEAALLHTRYRY